MGSIQRIIIGWFKSWGIIPTTEAELKLSELRLSMCVKCEFAKESSVLKLLRGNAEEVKILKCSICNCPCNEKTLVVKETCPKNKW